jgi:hypothetical protein
MTSLRSSDIRMANLYRSLPQPLEMSEEVLSAIISYDRPEILDEFIARTGLGIDMYVAQKHIGDTPGPKALNDKNRIYLGLNVHGKKRADLATQNDPDAQSSSSAFIPLIWRAAKKSAKGIISYLVGQRPLGAYRRYAESHTDERAMWLGGLWDLRNIYLCGWVGLRIHLGRTRSRRLSLAIMLKLCNGFSKKLLTSLWKMRLGKNELSINVEVRFIRLWESSRRIKLVGYNPLMLAIRLGSEPDKAKKVVDFLLAKSVSPAESDHLKGYLIPVLDV